MNKIITTTSLYKRLLKRKPVYCYNIDTEKTSKVYLNFLDKEYNHTTNFVDYAKIYLNINDNSIFLGDIENNKFIADAFAIEEIYDLGYVLSFTKLNKKITEGFNKIYKTKIPTSVHQNYVGVEIELLCPGFYKKDLEMLFVKAGLASKVQVDFDSSIESYETDPIEYVNTHAHGFEIRILDTEKNIYATIRKVSKILKSIKAFSNKSCGLHVHLDMRNKNKEECFKKLVNSLPRLKYKVASHRLNNEFCKLNDLYKRMEITERRSAINPQTGNKQTIEVRLHEGTLNTKKINSWIKELLKIVNANTNNKTMETAV